MERPKRTVTIVGVLEVVTGIAEFVSAIFEAVVVLVGRGGCPRRFRRGCCSGHHGIVVAAVVVP